MESDPIGLNGGLNTYGYVLGNRLKYIDPKGLSVLVAPGAEIGAAAGTLVCPGAGTAVGGAIGAGIGAGLGWYLGDKLFNESVSDAGADNGEKDPSTPTGQRGSPIEVEPGTNKPTEIDGREYSGHALDRMQGRGVPPSAVEDAIQNGSSSTGNTPGTTVHTGSNGVTVVTGSGGRVITVITR